MIDGDEGDCPLGKALLDLDGANDRIAEMEKEVEDLKDHVARLESAT